VHNLFFGGILRFIVFLFIFLSSFGCSSGCGAFFSMLLTAVWLAVVDRSQLGIAMKLERHQRTRLTKELASTLLIMLFKLCLI